LRQLRLSGENSEVAGLVEHVEIAKHRAKDRINQREVAIKPWRGHNARFKPRKALLQLGCLGLKGHIVWRAVEARDIVENHGSEFDPAAVLRATQGGNRMQRPRFGFLKDIPE
jgi:hypothetical protein